MRRQLVVKDYPGAKTWLPIAAALLMLSACQGGSTRQRAVADAGEAVGHAPLRQEKANATPPRAHGGANGSDVRIADSGETTPAKVEQLDRDGNDDAEPEGDGPFPAHGHFERVGRAPLSLRYICDLTPLGDTLYAAHSFTPLGADGATISRYRPSDTKRPFATAFDWNRPGEPTKGGGGGQGFLRVRAIDGRLYVPDADPPYNGFGLMDWGTEGYVFVSKTDGTFAYATRPHFRPPSRPTVEGRRILTLVVYGV